MNDNQTNEIRRRRRVRRTLLVVLLLCVAAVVLFGVLPPKFDREANAVVDAGPYLASPRADSLNARLTIVDLHSDQLLWNRPTEVRADRGQVDLPRLEEGNVALEVFSAVTKSPFGQNTYSNAGDSDRITALVILQRWPVRTWSSLTERALYQAEKLGRAASASNGRLRVIQSRSDLDTLLADRAAGVNVTGGLLAIEGLHAMEGSIDGYERLVNAGYRMMSITHFFDTELGGSAHGRVKGGLTDLGRETIGRMLEDGIVIDVAHVSPKSIDDILGMATAPVVASHTGVDGTCPSPRNLSDEQIDGIAATGGVIGIGFWDAAVCGTDPADIARAMRYVADRVGVEHVAVGSDYDGSVVTGFDVSGMALLTEALVNEGFADDEIRLIMGDNAIRVLRAVLK
ncbi:MAG: membrane dipeptidase [Rhodothermales bacterium]